MPKKRKLHTHNYGWSGLYYGLFGFLSFTNALRDRRDEVRKNLRFGWFFSGVRGAFPPISSALPPISSENVLERRGQQLVGI
ncbi:MAG: hypothetical protein DME49_12075 [Verrucomicrobia bacterium]|nr:MAG: hypothetical protein DME49_12075 [Verrucomicrobiota bacterium]